MNQYLDEHIIAMMIAGFAGLVRYLSKYLQGEDFVWMKMFASLVTASGMGLLAFYIAPSISDSQQMQYAIIYISGMISVELTKVIVDKIPNLVSNSIKGGK